MTTESGFRIAVKGFLAVDNADPKKIGEAAQAIAGLPETLAKLGIVVESVETPFVNRRKVAVEIPAAPAGERADS